MHMTSFVLRAFGAVQEWAYKVNSGSLPERRMQSKQQMACQVEGLAMPAYANLRSTCKQLLMPSNAKAAV
eukprot:6176127-Pleurochrysis_carterae.AAC.1